MGLGHPYRRGGRGMSDNRSALDLLGHLRERSDGAFTVDLWGLDPAWHHGAMTLAARRFAVRVAGQRRVPARGATMVVVNRGIGLSEPIVAAIGIYEATGRRARVVGLADVAVLGSLLRRVGVVLAHPDEVSSLLRAGELVVAPLSWRPAYGVMAGSLDVGLARAAVDTDATVLPSVARGRPWARSWYFTLGTALRLPTAPGRQSAVDLAEAARAAIQGAL